MVPGGWGVRVQACGWYHQAGGNARLALPYGSGKSQTEISGSYRSHHSSLTCRSSPPRTSNLATHRHGSATSGESDSTGVYRRDATGS